jgi:hypothetical protein
VEETMTDDPFQVDACDVQRHVDGIHIRLNFVQDSGESRAVVLRREKLPQLVAALQGEIVSGSVVPIDQGSLQIGANYQMEGHQIRKLQDGSAVLTLFVKMLDQSRTVTLALELTPSDVTSMIRFLGG